MVKPIEGKSETWTAQEEADLKDNISKLYSLNAAREVKFNRNLNRYYNNGQTFGDSQATVWSAGYQSLGYNRAMFDNSSVQTKLNLIKSVADTIMSKLSQARVRPFFDAVQGDYKTIKATRAAQRFFDTFFDAQKVYERAPEIARSAMLFDAGHWGIDEDEGTVEPVPHWELFVDPYEANTGGIRACTYGMRYRREYPLALVMARFPDAPGLAPWRSPGINPRRIKGQFSVYYDLLAGTKFYIWESVVLFKKTIEYKRLPFTSMFWTSPIVGWSSTCLADDLYTIQVQVDELELRIDQAIRQSPFNTVFTPAGSESKATMLSNEAGSIVEYMPGPEGGIPVVATPAPISPEFSRLLDFYIQKAYEFGGVSQLSAQSKKPAGISSGVALQTLEDVESERHNVTLQNFIHSFVEIAEIAVEVFPDNADVLPPAMGRAKIKWSDVKKQKDLFRIQFSAGSALSKDPATKVDQIQKLQALGINLQPILPQLLEIPDLETANSAVTASYDYVQSVIEKAIETGEVEFAPIVDMQMLFSEAVRWYLRLSADNDAAGMNKEYLANLKKLLDQVSAEQDAASAPDASQPGFNAAATAFNGGPLVAGTTAQPSVAMKV